MTTGVMLGLGAACCQSLSYIFSSLFVRTYKGGTLPLLVQAHVVMGAISAALLVALRTTAWPFLPPVPPLPPAAEFVPPLLSSTLFYMLGQVGLFLALRRVDASRVSPLLGLKLPILAAISVLFLGQRYSLAQWGAVGLCLMAAFLLNRSGGRVSAAGFGCVLLACAGYCLSDFSIRALVVCIRGASSSLAMASLVSVCLSYALCGAVALLWLPRVPWRVLGMWRSSVPFGLAWLAGMLFLFACFGTIGVVFGNIVQATRGIISIVIGAVIARLGHAHLETRIGPMVLVRRLLAAVLMVLAIALFSKG